LVTVAAHTHTHPVLSALHPRQTLRELEASREALENRLGRAVSQVAYPYGKNDLVVRTLATRAGFEFGFTTEERPVTRSDLRRRMTIPRYDLGGGS
jgi:peptidoglycan/xylan/chitin deacetylase (PgdA/CDA1 family)